MKKERKKEKKKNKKEKKETRLGNGIERFDAFQHLRSKYRRYR